MYTLIDGVQFYDKDEVDDLFAQNGSAGLSDRLDQEAIDRAAADDALGTRIDQEADRLTQESNMRLLGDQTLTNQLTAIEQLWSTLVSANFIDTDSSTIVVDDSGKSVRQIAHDEFYRQLVTDADDVKHQLDTLKELADYLQNNPTILTDIYTKLGLTWSLDTPTDFGTFDFSRVLTATDVDSAIVELHNTLVSKVGDLTQLTTTFKGNLVGAINEVKALAVAGGGGGGGGSGGADTTQLEAKLNAEIAARTQGDTDLGNRITASVGTLASLTTTAKDNLVAAVNEVKALAEAGGGGGGAGADIAQLEAELNEEVTARTQADTALGARIDGEVTARTQADTALGTRINTEVGTLSSLTTTAKDNLVAAVNELQTEVNTATSTANTAKSTANTAKSTADTNKTAIGTLSSLTTTAKTNLVAAVNELQTEVNTATSTANTAKSTANTAKSTADTNKTAIGTLSSLTTTAKTNLVAAVNELQTEVDTKLGKYTTSMKGGGFVSTARGYISLKDFWTKLVEKYGSAAEVFFSWALDSAGYVSIDGTADTENVVLNGSTVIYNCQGTPNGTWSAFSALVLPGPLHERPYIIRATVSASAGTLTSAEIYPLATASDASAVSSTYRYTYVVDSDAKLTAWANNDKSGGQDYTSVLIRKGNWTSSKGVNLTAAGTKVVVGEAGSIIRFNNIKTDGLYYTSQPDPSQDAGALGYYMQGVTTNSSFHYCVNLTNCAVVVPAGASRGFSNCINLSHCTSMCAGSDVVHAFLSCTNLTNCTGLSTSNNGSSHAFSSCDNITNCSGQARAAVLSYCFNKCNSVTNCVGVANYNGNDCTSVGFNGCANISNCIGTGVGSTAGAGFAACTGVARCKAGGHCTTGAFIDCYASSSKTSTYACADTANGGFNNTTNPAAR